MLTNQSFVDPQGQTYTDAVVRVKTANYSRSWNGSENTSVDLNMEEPTGLAESNSFNSENENQDLRIEFVYWPTQEDFDSGNRPYLLLNLIQGGFQLDFMLDSDELSKPEYDALTVEEKCELYFTNTILPTLV